MKKRFLVSLFFLLSICMIAQTPNSKYKSEWRQVEQFEQESLPQSALKTADGILRKAIADNNNMQVIKALIYKNKYKRDIDYDDNEGIFSDLEVLKTKSNDVCEEALLNSMLAELYSDYYNNDQWNINRRTNLGDVVPADMKEWSSNIFINKIVENLTLSIKNITILKTHTTKKYEDIVNFGKDEDKYPTLYDFLMKRAIEISQNIAHRSYGQFDVASSGVTIEQLVLPADEYIKLNVKAGADNRQLVFVYYKEYLKDLLQRNMIPTVILTEISKTEFITNATEKSRLEIYTVLEKKYEQNETCAEIIDKIIDSYSSDYSSNQVRINENKYNWIKKGLEKYPDSYGARLLKKKLDILESSDLKVRGKAIQYPDIETKLTVEYKNTQQIKEKYVFSLYKVEGDKYNVVKEFPLELISKTTYNADTLSLNIGKLPAGNYCFSNLSKTKLGKKKETPKEDEEVEYDYYDESDDNKFNFIVSSLISFSRNSAKDQHEIFVTDRLSGQPIKNVTVKVYPQKENNEGNASKQKPQLPVILKTNEVGIATYKHIPVSNDSYYKATYRIELGADSCLQAERLNADNYKWERQSGSNKDAEYCSVYTDRSIYRPGQTVHFKAIIISGNSKPITNKEYTVELYNTNHDLVSEKKIITNEFGSIAGEFVLPQAGLQGGYQVQVKGKGTAYFNVEEYKRPTFEITFDKIKDTYTFGEKVALKGYAKNFSGVNLQDAEVKYSITREPFSFWYWRSYGGEPFTDGTVISNADGSFEIIFTPESPDGISRLRNIYAFRIVATVTDLNGETQSNTFTVNVGDISMGINIEIPQQIEKSENYNININAKNLQGEEIKTSGTYTLYNIPPTKGITQNKILEGTFETGEQTTLKASLKSLASGKYQLQVKALDSKRNEVTEVKDFILFSYSDKKPPFESNEWLVKKNTIFNKKGKPAEVIFGVTDKDIYVLYQLHNNKKVFEQKIVKLNNENHLFTIPYKAEYGDEVQTTFTFVKDAKLYTQYVQLQKEEEVLDTKLNLKLEVFRDKLRPGQSETWTVSVKDSTNNPAVAELLASMYDTSIDKLYPYMPWGFNRPSIYKEYVYPIIYGGSWTYYRDYDQTKGFSPYVSDSPFLTPPPPPLISSELYFQGVPRRFDQLNWFGYIHQSYEEYAMPEGVSDSTTVSISIMDVKGTDDRYGVDIAELSESKIMIRGAAAPTSMKYKAEAGFLEEDASTMAEPAPPANEIMGGGETPQIRQNFSETAFFFPQLRTNEKGETLISFTVPETNTAWRFRALAHDKNSRVGTLEQLVITRKELMVTPNMPRFVRQGDKTSISTKISNLSDNAISGDVHIEFFDPITDKIIDFGIADQKQTFNAEKDASTSVSWTFQVPDNLELLGCRIVAKNETFSDGEQHVLAVLSNRMLVTESMPIDINKAGTSTFTFDKLYNNKSNTLENYKLTLEYASNPAWYAVQALPTLSNPSNENAVNWFASYYVNMLGSSIVRQYPKVAAMIESWKKTDGDKQTLISNLQKDEELKAVLLEETPWVLDAKDETEQMQRLSLLFDLNNTKQQTDAATSKLSDLLHSEGGWSWYKGLHASRSISQYILYGYAKLQQVGKVEYPQKVKEMQISALKYIDSRILEDFNNLKKNNKEWKKATSISTNQLEYAYVRSSYRDIPIDKETREAERFYTEVASKNWTKLNLYERSLLAVLLQRNGDKELVAKITKSMREHAVTNDKLGMYWSNNRSNVFMSLSAVSTHVFLMDALVQTGCSVEEANQMKHWLLKQKQTQVWESTHASIDAINALLSSGENWFTGEAPSVHIKVGNKPVDIKNKELGTGYFKTTWNKTEIDNNKARVEVEQLANQPAYGAMYWQYYEDMDKISTHKGDLNVEKQLFKESVSAAGKTLNQITENNILEVGDKVTVRLVVKVDRDMEFVHLKDMRASCFEPQQVLSGMKWADRLIYYQTTKDASTNFYFDHLPKGTYVLEYPVYVNRSGEYTNGISTIQCMYAPEFVSHTQGIKITVKDK